MTNKLLLIDTFNFLHRAYHALPKTFIDNEGNPTNAVYGVTSMLINIFDTIEPTYVVAALDSEKPTFRVEEFTGYKAQRAPMDEGLAVQIAPMLEIIDAFGIKRMTVDGYEADDIIGTVVTAVSGKKSAGMVKGTKTAKSTKGTAPADLEVIIASNDRDLWQLVAKNVLFMLPSTKGQAEWLGEKEIETRLGFDPRYLVDYKGLRGDPSDNIPGVYGVGDKAARTLIEQFGTIEEIFRNIQKVEPAGLREKLLNNYEEALISKKLATIIIDVPVEVNLEECRYKEFNKLSVKKVLEKYNFKSLIKRLGFDENGSRGKGKKSIESDSQLSLFS